MITANSQRFSKIIIPVLFALVSVLIYYSNVLVSSLIPEKDLTWMVKAAVLGSGLVILVLFMFVKLHAALKVMPLIIVILMSQTGYSYKLGQGFTSVLEVLTISVLITVLLSRALSGKEVFYRTFLDWKLYVYSLVSLIAVITGVVFGVDKLNILLEFKSYTLYVVYVFILGTVIREWRQLNYLVGLILIMSLIPVVYALMGVFDIENPVAERLEVVHWGPLNIYMGYIVPLFFLAIYCFFKTRRIWLKVALGVYLGVVTYSIFLSQTRSAWIALAVGIVLFTIVGRRKIFIGVIVSLIFAILAYAPLGEKAGSVAKRRMIEETFLSPDHSLRTRYESWETAWSVFKRYPVTGTGWGSFFIELDDGQLSSRSLHFLPRWHNSYLEILSQAGLLGLISFLLVWYTLLTRAFKEILKRSSTDQELLIGLTCAVVSCLVYAMGEQQFYRIETACLTWFLVGLLVAAIQLKGGEKQARPLENHGNHKST